jgi:carbohydrate-selective porin OprB
MRSLFASGLLILILATSSHAQAQHEDTLSGPDSHETSPRQQRHLFGEWGGERTRLFERGVRFDLQYISDTLWNVKSVQKERVASFNRVRGTVDIDFGALSDQPGLYFHATALWQAGGNLGTYLGLLTNPSGIASQNTFRLDSWWVEKRWLKERIVARAGQFAQQDFYGTQHYGASLVFEPMSYALGNLFSTDFETFDPPSTPAFEVRFIPTHYLYVKAMVASENRTPFASNPTGLVPTFTGVPVSVYEIGFTSGKKATSVRAFDNIETRRGYSGLYRFGASYNPGGFIPASGTTPQSGNYLFYWMANQALWRVDPKQARGLDATLSFDWSPGNLNRNNTILTAGLRFNEPLPIHMHNTMSVGYVRNGLSQQFVSPGSPPFKAEQGVEFNTLVDVVPMIILQPVIQYYANPSGGTGRDIVIGFRAKVDF